MEVSAGARQRRTSKLQQQRHVPKSTAEIADKGEPSFCRRIFVLGIVIFSVFTAVLIAALVIGNNRSDGIPLELFIERPCGTDAQDHAFEGCWPPPRRKCGRLATDQVITAAEADQMRLLAQRTFLLTGGGSGGASIFDFQSGALSKGDNFVSISSLSNGEDVISPDDAALLSSLRTRIQNRIVTEFGIASRDRLYLTKPTFLSRLTASPARTVNDEYWHEHIDREQYGSFDYTALVYLNDGGGADFDGGRFLFLDYDNNQTAIPTTSSVIPSKGRLVIFTSGEENRHRVEPVLRHERFALTIAFSCDPSAKGRLKL